ISSVSFNPSAVTGGTSSMGTITLASPAAAGGITVSLSSGDPSVTVPASVSFAAGMTSQTFTATTVGVVTQTVVRVTATLGASNTSGTLTVNPAVILSLTFSPNPVTGGTTSFGTVTLDSPAPAAGLNVALMSNNTGVAPVPPNISIPAGATTGTF